MSGGPLLKVAFTLGEERGEQYARRALAGEYGENLPASEAISRAREEEENDRLSSSHWGVFASQRLANPDLGLPDPEIGDAYDLGVRSAIEETIVENMTSRDDGDREDCLQTMSVESAAQLVWEAIQYYCEEGVGSQYDSVLDRFPALSEGGQALIAFEILEREATKTQNETQTQNETE